MGSRHDWTTEELLVVREEWTAGKSAAMISLTLGGVVSRSSVLGMVRRLGLPVREPSPVRPRPASLPPKKQVDPEKQKPQRRATAWEGPLILDDGSRVTLLTVNDRMCRWPIGDPGDEDFHFCGQSPQSGSPYCEPHSALGRDGTATRRYQERVAAARSAVRRA